MGTGLQEIKEKQERLAERSVALDAAITIAEMDPHSREDLICYLQALSESKAVGDDAERNYLIEAIAEVFVASEDHDTPDLDGWAAEAHESVEGRGAAKRLDDETSAFLKRYRELKNAAGFKTIRDVAEAAGLSPTTVQAVESLQVKPQERTIQALARAFGVNVTDLSG